MWCVYGGVWVCRGRGSGEMAQWLKTLAAFPGHRLTSPHPSLTTICNSSSGGERGVCVCGGGVWRPLLVFAGTAHTYAGKTLIYIQTHFYKGAGERAFPVWWPWWWKGDTEFDPQNTHQSRAQRSESDPCVHGMACLPPSKNKTILKRKNSTWQNNGKHADSTNRG